MWNICLWWLELKTVQLKLHLFAILLHVFRTNQFATLNPIVFHQGFYKFQPAQGAELSEGNYSSGMFPLLHCPENGLAFLASIFISIFFLKKALLIGATLWRSHSLSSLHPCSPRKNLGSPRTNLGSPTVHKVPSCFGVLWVPLAGAGEDTRGFFTVSEKEMSPNCWPFFFSVWIRAEEALRIYLKPQLWNPFILREISATETQHTQKKQGI